MKFVWWYVLILLIVTAITACSEGASQMQPEDTPAATVAVTLAPTAEPASSGTVSPEAPSMPELTETPLPNAPPLPPSAPVQTESGLIYIDVEAGTGAVAEPGTVVTVHYTGMLTTDNSVFDSSVERGDPFQFPLGAGMVIDGWEEGIAGMKVGGKRHLIIPPDLAYGERGFGDVIPPDSYLTFDVELLDVSR